MTIPQYTNTECHNNDFTGAESGNARVGALALTTLGVLSASAVILSETFGRENTPAPAYAKEEPAIDELQKSPRLEASPNLPQLPDSTLTEATLPSVNSKESNVHPSTSAQSSSDTQVSLSNAEIEILTKMGEKEIQAHLIPNYLDLSAESVSEINKALPYDLTKEEIEKAFSRRMGNIIEDAKSLGISLEEGDKYKVAVGILTGYKTFTAVYLGSRPEFESKYGFKVTDAASLAKLTPEQRAFLTEYARANSNWQLSAAIGMTIQNDQSGWAAFNRDLILNRGQLPKPINEYLNFGVLPN